MAKVLVVDDDEGILEAVSLILADEGYDVIALSTGKGIVDKVANDNIDLVILDVLLSGEDGRDIARDLAANEATKHIPVLLMSAHPPAEKDTQKVGAKAFIAKPFDVDFLLDNVEKYTP